MKIVSWNVNSIKARLDHVKKFLETRKPDVLMLQELKGLDFPDSEFTAMGYECRAVGQKAYNGVAILSKIPFTEINNALPGEDPDDQARFLEVEIEGMRLINIYLPNGNPVPGEKFEYKLRWMARLKKHLRLLRENMIPFAVGGDFNVIPEDRDCYSPAAWEGDALFRPESRAAFRELLNLGLTDAFRVYNQQSGQFTFWDYMAGRWQTNSGIRIDHFLLSPELADRLKSCEIDTEPRGWDKPSDHTPIIVEIQ